MSEVTTRNLTQDELDSYYRQYFIDQILDAINAGRVVRFVVHKSHFSLVTLQRVVKGDYEFSVAGEHRYTYRMSDFIYFIEQLYDSGAEVISLKDEVQLDVRHVTANVEA